MHEFVVSQLKMHFMSHIVFQFQPELRMFQHFRQLPNIKFHENRSAGSELLCVNREAWKSK
jgi:hypothetical protein